MNKQETWWSGPDGDAYSQRNKADEERTFHFFRRNLTLLAHIKWINSAIEFGANDGRNLKALKKLGVESVAGVEINLQACKELANVADEHWCGSMLDFKSDKKWGLTFTKGTLIHIAPGDLGKAYGIIYRHSSRYILIAEYFNPVFESVNYGGSHGLLWKGPHAEEMLEFYSDLKLLDYGFISKLDKCPEDNLTWWLMEKK